MNDFNILLTSVGRRSYLVDYFKQALKGQGQVICANMYAESAAMYKADKKFVVPPVLDKEYIPVILELCTRFEIKLICSFHDLDVYILSQHLDKLRAAGAFPVLPSPEWGRICLDKYECSRVIKEQGIDVPWTSVDLEEAIEAVNLDKVTLPLIVKARMGFGSLGLFVCHTIDELRWAYKKTSRQAKDLNLAGYISHTHEHSVLIQECLKGNEYCVDVINDLHGEYVCHFITQVHTMRAGESDTATTVKPSQAGDMPIKLSNMTRHLGIWGVDCMEDNGILKVIDINPRFTGDYPFHHISGANIPAALIAWVQGKEANPNWLQATAGISGYKDLVPRLMSVNTNRSVLP